MHGVFVIGSYPNDLMVESTCEQRGWPLYRGVQSSEITWKVRGRLREGSGKNKEVVGEMHTSSWKVRGRFKEGSRKAQGRFFSEVVCVVSAPLAGSV